MAKINILIRTGHRPELFKRALDSILSQSYKNYNIIVACDSETAWDYVPNWCQKIRVFKNTGYTHYWNFYCNELKEEVKDGWFFYLDDDDFLNDSKALERIVPHLTNPNEGIICQFIRNGKPKPSNQAIRHGNIVKGRIGSPSIILHASQKHLADWDGWKAADFRFIEKVASLIPMKFVQVVVVATDNNGLHGR